MKKNFALLGSMSGLSPITNRPAQLIGTVGTAARQGYYTIAACVRKQIPVTDEELRSISHFAMLADCYTDQCIIDQAGRKHRPCLPVFFRTVTAEERNEEDEKR